MALRQSEGITRMEIAVTRPETEAELSNELSDVKAQIARLQIRELFLQTRLRRTEADDSPRPGWPIARADQTSGRRISISEPSRIAV
jgi:hypothetical protein